MIANRQLSHDAASTGEPVATVTSAAHGAGVMPGAPDDASPARKLQARLADAIGVTPQYSAWQVDLGHTSNFDAAAVPQQTKSIIAGMSGGAIIALCLFMMLD